ncbi:MAG: hypothetical protein IT428_32305 [Planctomycetaceae bacterium]|nr:hypothetical protein [Planctomycetaceae bacterium]
MSGNSSDRPIQLKWDGGHVVITPEDEDRFVKEASWAVSACQNKLALERFVRQFKDDFLVTVHSWCVQQGDRVRGAFVPIDAASHLQVFVVTRLPRYDFTLSQALSDLETRLFEKSWPCDVLQIPDGSMESVQTFFDPERSIQVYGDAAISSHESRESFALLENNPG